MEIATTPRVEAVPIGISDKNEIEKQRKNTGDNDYQGGINSGI